MRSIESVLRENARACGISYEQNLAEALASELIRQNPLTGELYLAPPPRARDHVDDLPEIVE